MKAAQILFFLTFFLFHSCKNTNSGESAEIPEHSKGDPTTTTGIQGITPEGETYYAWVDKLRLRQKPDRKSKVIIEIPEGAEMIFLNEKTDFTEKVTLRGKQYDAPWMKVHAGDQTGWVYGGAIRKTRPRIDTSPSLYDPCFEKLSKGNDDAYASCRSAIMAKMLKKDSKHIQKYDTGYTITLLSGETVNLVHDLSEDENYRFYEYLYYLEKMGYFVFRVNFFETGQHLLIDDKFGYVKPIQGFPKPAPDFKKLIAVNASGAEGVEFNGIQVLGFTDRGLELLFEKEFDIYEPYLPKWMDERTIELQLVPFSVDQRRKPKKASLALDENNSWTLTD